MSDEFEDLEKRLRAAHASLQPRAGLQHEIRAGLRRPRELPWSGFAAAAAVLLAVGGVGFLLSRAPLGSGSPERSAASAGAPAYAPVQQAASFGLLPPLPSGLKSAAPAALGDQSRPELGMIATPAPTMAPVYRWTQEASTCPFTSPRATPTLDGYQVIGAEDCWLGFPRSTSFYRLAAAPNGAQLLYVAVLDGTVGYFEPAYRLPDGSVVTALTPDELRR